MNNIPEFSEIIEPNDQTEARVEHLEKLRELVGNVYPNKFSRSQVTGKEDTITGVISFEPIIAVADEMAQIKTKLGEGERPPAEEKDRINASLKEFGTVRIAGRLTTPPRGNFVHLTDGISKLQIYCDKKNGFGLVKNDGEDTLDAENGWNAWKLIDHGDFVGVEGYLFVTNTGEVSLHVEKLQFLAKAMLPMPDKMHGIADPEIRRRYRYVDLIASTLQVENEGLTTREVFERRAKLISGMRRYLDDHGYVEVETPMLTPKATGAAAKPFETHHNALDIPLYARIAPELYLKRLTVGGFEKVYELNRNFRNEGLSQRHNPEFTMLEFYAAYMDVNGMMDFAEAMIQEAVKKANKGSLVVNYDGTDIDFAKFKRVSMKQSVLDRIVETQVAIGQMLPTEFLGSIENLLIVLEFLGRASNLETNQNFPQNALDEEGFVKAMEKEWISSAEHAQQNPHIDKFSVDELILQIFEEYVEGSLVQPTFIVDYPKSISPLSKASPTNANIAERFELFINGMEIANGFSELNDPKEQYERFVDQMAQREGGDEEAMMLDEDYIRALSYGMPPAAGIGIGIDRLVMLLTNKHSIRDVILFPHMRPEKRVSEGETEE